MYILIAISMLYDGSTVQMQEFSTLERCSVAANTIIETRKKLRIETQIAAFCTQK